MALRNTLFFWRGTLELDPQQPRLLWRSGRSLPSDSGFLQSPSTFHITAALTTDQSKQLRNSTGPLPADFADLKVEKLKLGSYLLDNGTGLVQCSNIAHTCLW